ncbi:hypothetical protein BgAZ_502390 [Babesia gibsoni]|uniref:Uncharacterized protein n=1 Tax=Babesia gibsoni TaxID=33632 RepID=A0AAD8LHX5_BABGI|nr:hypothetical protein BgAZ_502390 [Babesia gibsoni]
MVLERHIAGAKLLIAKAFAPVKPSNVMCEELTAVADIPLVLMSPSKLAFMPSYSSRIISTVLTFVRKDHDFPLKDLDDCSQCYIAGDPTGCVRVNFPNANKVPPKLEGQSYIAFDIAVVTIKGKLYLQVLEGSRMIILSKAPDSQVFLDNDISMHLTCGIEQIRSEIDVPYV